MSKKENRSITYIYDEMDPSEKVEFERDLKSDANLLIEVESFKRITNRLDSLSTIEPPKEIVEEIHKKAHLNNRKQLYRIQNPTVYLVAALLIFGLTSGFLLLAGEETQQSTNSADTATIASPTLLHQSIQAASSSSGNAKITPWIDNDEILHFQDRFQSDGTASIDSIFKNSFRKLVPVTNPSNSIPNQKNLHLTGNRR